MGKVDRQEGNFGHPQNCSPFLALRFTMIVPHFGQIGFWAGLFSEFF